MKIHKFILLILIFFCIQLPSFSQSPNLDFEGQAKKAKDKIKKSSSQSELINEYNKYSLTHLKRSFNWHLISTIIIFFVVHMIILIGLYFSYIQFKNTVVKGNQDLSTSSIKINKDGLEISSSVLGVITLLISLVFFYLYIENIYPVSITNVIAPELPNDKGN